ncbi:hypothetical protein LSCM1_01813 [Leishmania martiniquensis]|uniref:Uncharacterized protein n=1 Tax=Leishmania martiniquensis TaxID=1580590 RepID=A0A836KBS1_9TRYP|nr:hypothetical protein LSCM1_01813 [Leishmania martiniquensis]
MQPEAMPTGTNMVTGEVTPVVAAVWSLQRSSSNGSSATWSASPEQQHGGERTSLKVTAEKVAAPETTRHEARAPCHHSRASSSAESRDYVDELASSVFLDCRSAATLLTMYSPPPQQLASFTDQLSFTTREVSPVPPSTLQIRTFHPSVSEDSEERNEQRGGEDDAGHNAEKAEESGDAASEAAAEQDATVEVIVAIDDEATPAPRETLDRRQMASAADEASDAAEATLPDSPERAWQALHERHRWLGKRLLVSRGELSTEEAEMAPTPVGASSSAALRRNDSREWAATRRTALERLRANLHQTAMADSAASRPHRFPSQLIGSEPEVHVLQSSSDAVASPGHALQPSDSFEDYSKAIVGDESVRAWEAQDPPRPEVNTAADILEQLLGDSYINNGASMVQLSRSPKDPATDSDINHGERITSLIRTTHTPVKATGGLAAASMAAIGASGSRFVVRPALSAEVSGISPIKNEAPSVLADLYNTPDPRLPGPVVSTPASGRCAVATPSSHRHGRRTLQDALEAMAEPSADVATADFCTAQTAPSASSALAETTPVDDRVVRDASIVTVAAASDVEDTPSSRNSGQMHHAALLDRRRVLSSVVLDHSGGGGASSGVQSPAKVNFLSQVASSSYEASRLNSGRARGRHPQPRTEYSAEKASPASPVDENAALSRLAQRRQHRIEQEMRAKEMAECTFHPLLSPGTRAMVRLAQERELERTVQEEGKAKSGAAGARSQRAHTSSQEFLDPSTLRATLQTVYERLYPAELSAAASRRQILDQEMEYRHLAREELILLRRRCGIGERTPLSARGGGATRRHDQFSFFMSNILQTDWKEAAAASAAPPVAETSSSPAPLHGAVGAGSTVAVVQTSYKSPMAVALREEKNAKRKYNSRREAEMQGQHGEVSDAGVAGRTPRCGAAQSSADNAETARAHESFRVALFDEFLLRQNAYYFNRARTVRDLEKMMTPDFVPSTTDVSTWLVRRMVSRSLLNESMGPETSSIVAQRQRQRIPFTSAFIKQHTSPYVDPCTFQPSISPAARAAKDEAHRRRRANKESTAAQQQSFFERLYADQERRARRREDAKKRVEAEEVEGLTFQPTLNVKSNVRVHSMLNPRNYQPYQAYLQEKRRALEAKRRELEEEAKKAEEDRCTFRPQTTRKPAYIEKMAKNFGVLRKQDIEF